MRIALICIVLIVSLPVMANENRTYCFDDAAKKTGVNRDILVAIAMQESSVSSTAVHKNKNGSEDIGVMQINTDVWLNFIAEAGVSRNDLFKPCVNIHVGALILKDCIRVFGNTWKAVGAYNVGYKLGKTRDLLRYKYMLLVWNKYSMLNNISASKPDIR
jgi:soluble lytic murein transglycosylase-like protein